MCPDVMNRLRENFKEVFDTWIAWGESTEEERKQWGEWIKSVSGDDDMMLCVCFHFEQLREKYA